MAASFGDVALNEVMKELMLAQENSRQLEHENAALRKRVEEAESIARHVQETAGAPIPGPQATATSVSGPYGAIQPPLPPVRDDAMSRAIDAAFSAIHDSLSEEAIRASKEEGLGNCTVDHAEAEQFVDQTHTCAREAFQQRADEVSGATEPLLGQIASLKSDLLSQRRRVQALTEENMRLVNAAEEAAYRRSEEGNRQLERTQSRAEVLELEKHLKDLQLRYAASQQDLLKQQELTMMLQNKVDDLEYVEKEFKDLQRVYDEQQDALDESQATVAMLKAQLNRQTATTASGSRSVPLTSEHSTKGSDDVTRPGVFGASSAALTGNPPPSTLAPSPPTTRNPLTAVTTSADGPPGLRASAPITRSGAPGQPNPPSTTNPLQALLAAGGKRTSGGKPTPPPVQRKAAPPKPLSEGTSTKQSPPVPRPLSTSTPSAPAPPTVLNAPPNARLDAPSKASPPASAPEPTPVTGQAPVTGPTAKSKPHSPSKPARPPGPPPGQRSSPRASARAEAGQPPTVSPGAPMVGDGAGASSIASLGLRGLGMEGGPSSPRMPLSPGNPMPAIQESGDDDQEPAPTHAVPGSSTSKPTATTAQQSLSSALPNKQVLATPAGASESAQPKVGVAAAPKPQLPPPPRHPSSTPTSASASIAAKPTLHSTISNEADDDTAAVVGPNAASDADVDADVDVKADPAGKTSAALLASKPAVKLPPPPPRPNVRAPAGAGRIPPPPPPKPQPRPQPKPQPTAERASNSETDPAPDSSNTSETTAHAPEIDSHSSERPTPNIAEDRTDGSTSPPEPTDDPPLPPIPTSSPPKPPSNS